MVKYKCAWGLLVVLVGACKMPDDNLRGGRHVSTTQDLRDQLKREGLTPLTIDTLLSKGAVSTRMVPATVSNELASEAGSIMGCLGGPIALPLDAKWPTFRKERLPFVGCIGLAGLPASMRETEMFPREGVLLFFYDGESDIRGMRDNTDWPWKVLFLEKFSENFMHGPGCHPMRFKEELTLPCETSTQFEELSFSIEDTERYCEFIVKRCRETLHRVGGYPDALQRDVFRSLTEHFSQWKNPGSRKWVLLLQVDSDKNLGLNFIGGRVYFVIGAEDLARRDFTKVLVITQRT